MRHPIVLALLAFPTLFPSGFALADDCAFIRDAIAALPEEGGEVLIPSGTFNCDAPIVVSRSDVTLRGASREKTVLRLADQKHAPLLVIGERKTVMNDQGQYVAEHRVRKIVVSDLTLDGNRAHHDTSKECGETTCDGDPGAVRNNGLTIRGASNVLIENVVAHGTISGGMVTEKYCDNLTVRNFESYDNFFDGFAGYETEHSNFSGLFLHNNRGARISIDINFNQNVVRDSRLENNGDVGIFARNLNGNQFLRLKILHSGNHGVFLAASDAGAGSCARDNTFDSVIINGSKRAGIRVNNGCPGNRVTGNSDLCQNAEGAFSEEKAGSLAVDKNVLCR